MRSFILVSGGNIARQFLMFFAQMYMVRTLGVEVFGELTIAFSLYLVGAGISDFGSRLYCWKAVISANIQDRLEEALKQWISRTFLALFLLIPMLVGILFFFQGSLRNLLLLYALATLANQASFDWFFLALDRKWSLFFFNAASGVCFVIFLLLFVRAKGDEVYVPIIFLCSYLMPALLLMGKDVWRKWYVSMGSFRGIETILRDGAILPLKSRHYFLYDFLQRLYMTSIFIVAWKFYSRAMIGQFRIAHLLFTLVASLSTYLGAALFNQVHEESKGSRSGTSISYGIAAILLVVLPFSISGYSIIDPIANLFMTSKVDSASLQILILGLSLPALANFIRETSVAGGHSRIASSSYLVTIVVTAGLIVIFHQHSHSLAYLSVNLLLGECLGLLYLLYAHPTPLIVKVRFRTYIVGVMVGGAFWGLEIFLSSILKTQGKEILGVEMILMLLLSYIFYLFFIRKNGMKLWVIEDIENAMGGESLK